MTYLDHLESNRQDDDTPEVRYPDRLTAEYLPQGLGDPDRDRIRDALVLAGTPENSVLRYCQCGSHAWIYRHRTDPDRLQVRSDACRSRWCPACASRRGREIADNMRKVLRGKVTRLVTFTLRHSKDALRQQLDRLYRCFLKVRRSKDWSSRVTGGIQVLEIKLSKDQVHYHPHLHVIVTGTYYPHNLLRSQWERATGDSKIVDIRLIDENDDATKYVTKYLTKPVHGDLLVHPDKLADVISQTKGRRFIFAFGILKSSLTRRQDVDTDWIPIAPLSELIRRSLHGDQFAIEVLSIYRDGLATRKSEYGETKCQTTTSDP